MPMSERNYEGAKLSARPSGTRASQCVLDFADIVQEAVRAATSLDEAQTFAKARLVKRHGIEVLTVKIVEDIDLAVLVEWTRGA
jgi:hypothetical protein